ncbi:telomerase protein component 1 [Aplysia californica]|uniref:Telomerase protein component 1 n=1 Tax=Aplysia californica TaxID=6500 RepID=A0ABM0K9X7_APLCA|nr:telomerase protein component 1 [Aplysia californica]
MYRSYIKGQVKQKTGEEEGGKTVEPDGNNSDDDVDDSVKSAVNKVWSEVGIQCDKAAQYDVTNVEPVESNTASDWNIIRVFVSSTFTDFFNEREVLVKKVFPELREWCLERRLKLVECDLRWGIPKDTSTAETILICMEEIERCRDKHMPHPLFITLVGERYGWIPSSEEVPAEAKEKYDWIDGTSITFMEILNGAYRECNPNAGFFMRSKSICDDIPESFQSRFVDSESLPNYHLKVMKKKIAERFPTQLFPYSCSYKQISDKSGRDRVELVDMDEFAEKVLNFLKNAIDQSYPPCAQQESVDSIKQELNLQRLFAVDKAKDLVGREAELKALLQFLSEGSSSLMEEYGGDNCTVRQSSEWDIQEGDNEICVLEAASGWGKTALMCKLIGEAVKKGVSVFYHIVDSTPSSGNLECLLSRLIAALLPEPTEDEKKILTGGDTTAQAELLKTSLARLRERDARLWIIIDGVNQLENSGSVYHLSWLPPLVPRNVRCVVSSNHHPPTLARLYEHPVLRLRLQCLSPEELTQVAVCYLDTFNKKLDSDQIQKLMLKTHVDNPLWMMLMAEELRIFGDFKLMDDKIDSFPESMDQLLVQILERLIQEDDENGVIKKVLCLVACSRHGLPSDQILRVCGNIGDREELAPLYWARARRSLKPYLRSSGALGESITFCHQAVTQAVHSHLLNRESDVVFWHATLADYFQYWCDDVLAKIWNLPHHLKRARLKKRLVDFMSKDPHSYQFINPWMRSNLLSEVRCRQLADPVLPSTVPLMMCQVCSMKNRSLNPACAWQNKLCCVVCGAMCHLPRTLPARACSRHNMAAGRNMVKCVLCKNVIHLGVKTGPVFQTPAQLCMHCGFGNRHVTCAMLE